MAWAPMTAESIYRASLAFDVPFASLRQCREELRKMLVAGLLGRCPVPGTGRGQKPFAYHLSHRACAVVPDTAMIPRSNAVFQGLDRNPWHALAVSEFWSLFEASVGRREKFRVLERIRDRQFVAPLPTHSKIVPDGTVLLDVAGRRKILFLELVNETAIINPGAEATRARSLFDKLARYRVFRGVRGKHPTWKLLEKAYGVIHGFQVLVVTTRPNTRHLISAAEGSNTMFLFAELAELRAAECILEAPVWWLPRSPWRPNGAERTRLSLH